MNANSPSIVVVGSVNMDLVVRLREIPRPGETVLGDDLKLIPGGKGANQAVAAARLGAESRLIGRVGDDAFGADLRRHLQAGGVIVDHLLTTTNCSSGVAVISVETEGENSITIISGANGRLSPADLKPFEQVIGGADILLLQLEIPPETVAEAIALAKERQVTTILDPAPAPPEGLPDAFHSVDIITPNQSEAERLTGATITGNEEAEKAGRELLARGAGHVVLKLGAVGAMVVSPDKPSELVPAYVVRPVDTTAAGDAFTAALGYRLACGDSPAAAASFAAAAGALATTRFGAQPSMPTRSEVYELMQRNERTS